MFAKIFFFAFLGGVAVLVAAAFAVVFTAAIESVFAVPISEMVSKKAFEAMPYIVLIATSFGGLCGALWRF